MINNSKVWKEVFSFIKIVTGNVEVAEKGSLQEQVKQLEQGNNLVEFEDYSGGEETLNPEDAINQITSGKSIKVLNQYVKAALKGLLALAQRALNVAMGKNQAHVFDTVAALDAWLAIPKNVAELNVGDNFYIIAPDVPDYWWDGAQKQKLETQKVDLTTYDREIAALKQKDSELSGNISSHTHDGRYYTESEINTKLTGKSDTSHSHAWSAITGKPTTFAPSTHSHDDKYYTETEMNNKLAGKSDTSHSHKYAGSSSAGGSATSAVKLDSSAGNALQPVYFNGGKPTACTRKIPTITTTEVAINRTFTIKEGTLDYEGNVPNNNGFAIRLGGYCDGDVLLCTPNGWIQNTTGRVSMTIKKVVWIWLVV